MIERIKLISNIGNYIDAKPSHIEFKPVNIIYGENRNGKSTLCDIFYSLALNNPQIVTDRKSIILQTEGSQIDQKINIKFSGRQDLKFKDSKWDATPPEDSKLYIFDHGFIHRNVMTGINYTRENSTNMSGFILGENAKHFEDLEIKNQEIRDNKKKLIDLESEIRKHNIGNFNSFITSPIPSMSEQVLNEEIALSRKKQIQLRYQIENIKQVQSRPLLENIPLPQEIEKYLDDINNCLNLSINTVHDNSKKIIENHKFKIINPDSFNSWITYGLQHLKDDCPFCGQNLDDNALILIESYKQAFNQEYEKYLNQVKEKISYFSRYGLPNLIGKNYQEIHHKNIIIKDLYPEETIKNQIDTYFINQLIIDFEFFEKCLYEYNSSHKSLEVLFQDSLKSKLNSPHKPISAIDFSYIKSTFNELKNSISNLNHNYNAINILLDDFKKTQSIDILHELENKEQIKINELDKSIKRYSLNELCINYIKFKDRIKNDDSSYKISKKKLETDQEEFLNTYFIEINTLFKSIGSRNFEISRSINRIGARTVYELSVSFNGCVIDRNKFHCLFSESDRRALAFCIFIAKIHQLPTEERSKAILVLDDPVTSFDSERISSILRLLYKLQPSIKQLIITTHYKGMASAVLKKFTNAQALKIIQDKVGSQIEKATTDELTATAHDEAYIEILKFIQRETQDNKIMKLRVFLENEVHNRYRLCIAEVGLNFKSKFSDCIQKLNEHNYISDEVAKSLNEFRTTLNRPAHELELWSIEDSRNYADQMMNFIYKEL